MQTSPSWPDIAVRIAFAAAAGIMVGDNREARSQAAGAFLESIATRQGVHALNWSPQAIPA